MKAPSLWNHSFKHGRALKYLWCRWIAKRWASHPDAWLCREVWRALDLPDFPIAAHYCDTHKPTHQTIDESPHAQRLLAQHDVQTFVTFG